MMHCQLRRVQMMQCNLIDLKAMKRAVKKMVNALPYAFFECGGVNS